MGIAQAGLAFRPTNSISDVRSFISNLCGEEATEIKRPNIGQFDTRNHTDVMVQFFEDVCFICNDDLAWELLEKPQSNATQTYRSLGSPELFLAFCHYDSGGSYGYAFFEGGKRTRSRLQTTGIPSLPPLIEYGNPKDFEQRWFSANFYIEEDDCPIEQRQKIYYLGNRETEVPEHFLTSRMLDEALVANFGVCPWETSLEPTYRFFRLSAKKKPWWKLWQ